MTIPDKNHQIMYVYKWNLKQVKCIYVHFQALCLFKIVIMRKGTSWEVWIAYLHKEILLEYILQKYLRRYDYKSTHALLETHLAQTIVNDYLKKCLWQNQEHPFQITINIKKFS